MEVAKHNDIFSYITAMETAYRSKGVPLNDVWTWSMFEHIRLTTLYKNSQFSEGNSKAERDYKPMKNITRPILNLQHRAEGFDVKDIQLFVNDPANYYKSFLVKKFHEKWARLNHLDTFIDELVESYVDFGGVLVKDVGNDVPEVVQLASIAFCDQTDILSGPIAIKHYFSPDQLLDMEAKGWGSPSKGATASLEDVIALSRESKRDDKNGTVAETPGRYIEVYEVHGNLPKQFANRNDHSGKYETRLFIVCFYQKQGSTERQGIVLYTGKESESPFKFLKRDPVFGRALGFGGAEELFEPQVWVNYNMKRMQDMLDAAAKTILLTNDPTLRAKHPNGLKDVDNLELLDEALDGNTRQLDTTPKSFALFENAVQQWEMHAQQMGSANDSIMGDQPASGTPFKLQELVTAESHSLHEYRKGKIATFLDEIYMDRIIPSIARHITEGQQFLAELDMDELQYVSKAIVTGEVNDFAKKKILSGQVPDQQELDLYEQVVKDEFMKGGNKRFVQIFKDEMKDAPLDVEVNIVGKQKNLAQTVDKLTNIFRFAFSNPQGFAATMQIPGMAKAFNEIIEYSGLSPIDFSGVDKLAMPDQTNPQPQDQTQPQPSPMMATAS